MSDEQSVDLADAIAAIAKSECPGDWVRYCQLAHVPGSNLDPEAEARDLLIKRPLSIYDTTYAWVEGAPHLKEAITLENRFVEHFLIAIRDGRVTVCHFAGDDFRRAVVPFELLTPQSLQLHNGIMQIDGRKLFCVHVIFTSSQGAPGRKPGVKTVKDRACNEALTILKDDARRPPRRGRRTTIAQMVQSGLVVSYKLNSIEKMIRGTIADWEIHNPNK